MNLKNILGRAAAETSRYDWGLALATYVLGVVAFRLGAPLWAAAIVAFSGNMVVCVKHSCRNLGLLLRDGRALTTSELQVRRLGDGITEISSSATRPFRSWPS